MNKKFLSLFIVALFIFSNCTYALAADDTTPPTIKGMTWSATELKIGDNLEIEIDASDLESGINTGSYDTSIYIKHKVTGIYKAQQLTYDIASNKFKATFPITSDMQSGTWIIYFISLKDNAGNHNSYLQSDLSQEYKVNILGGTTDTTPPTLTGMTWSATELQSGDNLKIEIDASDLESGISTGSYDTSIYIQHSVTGIYKAQKLTYDEVTNKLNATFPITSDMQSGTWIIYFISLKDNAGNHNSYHQSDLSQEYKVNILGGTTDTTPPTLTGMTWSATELQSGDNLEIEIDASDLESGINTGSYDTSIYIQHSVTGIYKAQKLTYDEVTNKLKATFPITSDMQSGEWVLYFISLKDNAGNHNAYHQSDLSQIYKVNLKSVFQGTENKPIQKGTQFNALDGVATKSSFEGDFSDKITYTGSVDYNTEGIYLIKYEATGKNGDVYKDYRWISVVSNLAYDDNGELQGIYFNKDISINLSNVIDSSSIQLIKDDSTYSLDTNGTISEEGDYTLSFNSTVNQVNSSPSLKTASEPALSESSTDIQPSDFEFTIDKTSPKILEIYPQTIDEDTKISADKFIKASDNNNNKITYSYVTEPKWNNIGLQYLQISVKDLAGNQVTQESKINITDKCDIDINGQVNIVDLASVAHNYNNNSTISGWNPRLDFNKDGIIDIFDIVTISKRISK